MKNIAVFCGSSLGRDKIFAQVASDLGKFLGQHGYGVIYGGAKVGLMGVLADAAMTSGGNVIGVIPGDLKRKEIAHYGITELIEVDSMHKRKEVMSTLCDGVIALPGGFGTMDELFEMLTWSQLGYHQLPIGILNVNGFYDHLQAQVTVMVDQGFLKSIFKDLLIISDSIENLLEEMEDYKHQASEKWIKKA